MVNYTLGDGFKKMTEFEVKHTSGDICISSTLDFETRNSYEFPVIATDQGNCRLSMVDFETAEQKKNIIYTKYYKSMREKVIKNLLT